MRKLPKNVLLVVSLLALGVALPPTAAADPTIEKVHSFVSTKYEEAAKAPAFDLVEFSEALPRLVQERFAGQLHFFPGGSARLPYEGEEYRNLTLEQISLLKVLDLTEGEDWIREAQRARVQSRIQTIEAKVRLYNDLLWTFQKVPGVELTRVQTVELKDAVWVFTGCFLGDVESETCAREAGRELPPQNLQTFQSTATRGDRVWTQYVEFIVGTPVKMPKGPWERVQKIGDWFKESVAKPEGESFWTYFQKSLESFPHSNKPSPSIGLLRNWNPSVLLEPLTLYMPRFITKFTQGLTLYFLRDQRRKMDQENRGKRKQSIGKTIEKLEELLRRQNRHVVELTAEFALKKLVERFNGDAQESTSELRRLAVEDGLAELFLDFRLNRSATLKNFAEGTTERNVVEVLSLVHRELLHQASQETTLEPRHATTLWAEVVFGLQRMRYANDTAFLLEICYRLVIWLQEAQPYEDWRTVQKRVRRTRRALELAVRDAQNTNGLAAASISTSPVRTENSRAKISKDSEVPTSFNTAALRSNLRQLRGLGLEASHLQSCFGENHINANRLISDLEVDGLIGFVLLVRHWPKGREPEVKKLVDILFAVSERVDSQFRPADFFAAFAWGFEEKNLRSRALEIIGELVTKVGARDLSVEEFQSSLIAVTELMQQKGRMPPKLSEARQAFGLVDAAPGETGRSAWRTAGVTESKASEEVVLSIEGAALLLPGSLEEILARFSGLARESPPSVEKFVDECVVYLRDQGFVVTREVVRTALTARKVGWLNPESEYSETFLERLPSTEPGGVKGAKTELKNLYKWDLIPRLAPIINRLWNAEIERGRFPGEIRIGDLIPDVIESFKERGYLVTQGQVRMYFLRLQGERFDGRLLPRIYEGSGVSEWMNITIEGIPIANWVIENISDFENLGEKRFKVLVRTMNQKRDGTRGIPARMLPYYLDQIKVFADGTTRSWIDHVKRASPVATPPTGREAWVRWALVPVFNIAFADELRYTRPEDMNLRRMLVDCALRIHATVDEVEKAFLFLERQGQGNGLDRDYMACGRSYRNGPAWTQIRTTGGVSLRDWAYENAPKYRSFEEFYAALLGATVHLEEPLEASRVAAILRQLDPSTDRRFQQDRPLRSRIISALARILETFQRDRDWVDFAQRMLRDFQSHKKTVQQEGQQRALVRRIIVRKVVEIWETFGPDEKGLSTQQMSEQVLERMKTQSDAETGLSGAAVTLSTVARELKAMETSQRDRLRNYGLPETYVRREIPKVVSLQITPRIPRPSLSPATVEGLRAWVLYYLPFLWDSKLPSEKKKFVARQAAVFISAQLQPVSRVNTNIDAVLGALRAIQNEEPHLLPKDFPGYKPAPASGGKPSEYGFYLPSLVDKALASDDARTLMESEPFKRTLFREIFHSPNPTLFLYGPVDLELGRVSSEVSDPTISVIVIRNGGSLATFEIGLPETGTFSWSDLSFSVSRPQEFSEFFPAVAHVVAGGINFLEKRGTEMGFLMPLGDARMAQVLLDPERGGFTVRFSGETADLIEDDFVGALRHLPQSLKGKTEDGSNATARSFLRQFLDGVLAKEMVRDPFGMVYDWCQYTRVVRALDFLLNDPPESFRYQEKGLLQDLRINLDKPPRLYRLEGLSSDTHELLGDVCRRLASITGVEPRLILHTKTLMEFWASAEVYRFVAAVQLGETPELSRAVREYAPRRLQLVLDGDLDPEVARRFLRTRILPARPAR